MKVILTGHRGYIGAVAASVFCEAGHEVVGLDTDLYEGADFGAPFNPTGYFKDPFGIIHLRGTIASGTINTAAFTLPAGYRPANTERIGVNSNDAMGRLHINSTGTVVPVIGNNASFCLDGITFRAA